MKLIREIDERIEKGRAAIFECPYCQKEFKANIGRIKTKRQKSCGCLTAIVARERAKNLYKARKPTDQRTKTRLYRYWQELKQNCNPNTKKYNGSTICKEWEKYEPFKEWYDENYIEGKFLCWNNRHISPETCYFEDKKSGTRKKINTTNLELYGEEEFCSTNIFKNKARETLLDKYGVDHISKNPESKIKAANSLKNKTKEEKILIRNKVKETNIEKYGVDYPQKLEEFKNKMIESRKLNNFHIFIDDKTISQYLIDNNIDICYTTAIKLYHKYGNDFIKYIPDKLSSLEKVITNILESNNIEYSTLTTVNGCRTDIVIDKLIVECDGLYWHSDAMMKNNSYHANKHKKYKEAGYDCLFFRENEILNKQQIIESILLNKLKKTNNKVYARKCSIKEISKKEASVFCQENHLMGSGQGRSFGLLFDNKLLSVIRIKKKNDGIDISRFCHKKNYSVIGGFSKLLKFIEKEMNPKFVQTFIDQRYGSGEYLKDLNFKLENNDKSFYWTDLKKVFHRSKFPGNSGYEIGLYKIWDCGQAKWVKYV